MKYKTLTTEELKELEPEFIKYLAANSITADDWETMKKHEPQKTSDMIDHFSELVFESIFNRMDFLEFRSKNKLIVFKCEEETIHSIVMESEANDTDFTHPDFFKTAMNNPEGIKIFKASKEYTQERNLELFEMTEKGCYPTGGKLYSALKETF